MGHQSNVSGYIKVPHRNWMEHNRQAIAAYPYDKIYPFTNIFWCDSPAQYHWPLIGFAGSYKEIETDWNEWLWKFSQLLTTLEANQARVYLDGIRGSHYWHLKPYSHTRLYPAHEPRPFSTVGQPWGIVASSPNDFTLKPWVRDNVKVLPNPDTGKLERIVWTLQVERWTEPPLPQV